MAEVDVRWYHQVQFLCVSAPIMNLRHSVLSWSLVTSPLLVVAQPAMAQWIPNGTAVCAAPGPQDSPVICTDGGGSAFIVWRDGRSLATTNADVYIQHVLADGTIARGWPLDGLPVANGPAYEAGAAIVPD